MSRPGRLAIIAIAASALVGFAAMPGAASEKRGALPCPGASDTAPDQLKLNAARASILCLLNHERSTAGLPPLKKNKALQKASQKHNKLMDGTGCFAHLCPPKEKGLSTRVKKTGYFIGAASFTVAENVAWGGGSAGSPRSIVDAWMHSSGHRANILSENLSEVGVGYSLGSPEDGSEVAGTYTTDFGHRVTRSSAIAVPMPVTSPQPPPLVVTESAVVTDAREPDPATEDSPQDPAIEDPKSDPATVTP